MAIYQYAIQLIPKKSIAAEYGQIPNHLIIPNLSEDLTDNEITSDIQNAWTFDWWKNQNVHYRASKDFLDSFLSEIQWSKDFQSSKSYGNSSNDVSIEFSEDEMIDGIYCRIDLGKIDEVFITTILKLAYQLNCLILDRKGSLFEPSFKHLFEHVKNSNSFRFITIPIEFLEKLVTEELRQE